MESFYLLDTLWGLNVVYGFSSHDAHDVVAHSYQSKEIFGAKSWMPATPRGLLLPSIIRRNVSTARSQTPTPKLTTPKGINRPSVPPQATTPSPPKPQTRPSRSSLNDSSSKQSQSAKHGILHSFLFSARYKLVRRMIVLSPVLMLALLHSPYEIMTVNGPSMSPLFNANHSDILPTKDRVLVQRWYSPEPKFEMTPRSEQQLPSDQSTDFQRGQIITFHTPHSPDKIAVKRIVAIPGDLVQPLPGYPGGDDPVPVPWNHLWVEGDAESRVKSVDSNWYGPISQNLVLGEVRAVRSQWWKWKWVDWRLHTWPAREKARVEENAIVEATIDPDEISYSRGWTDGSIALILERMRKNPDQALEKFVNNSKARQETRKLYNNALYVSEVAHSGQEKELAKNLRTEMEDLYGREALVFGIRMRRRERERGNLPDSGNSKLGERAVKDTSASDAEKWLKKQGWDLERNADGSVKTQVPGHV